MKTDILAVVREAAGIALLQQGLALVPKMPTESMLKALDADGDRIWDASTEHWFGSEEEAFWYARQAWAAMIRAGRIPL
jgi:hypothetical protein